MRSFAVVTFAAAWQALASPGPNSVGSPLTTAIDADCSQLITRIQALSSHMGPILMLIVML